MNGSQKWCVCYSLQHGFLCAAIVDRCTCHCSALHVSLQENIPPPMTPQDHLKSCPRTTMVSAASPLSVIQYSSVSISSRRKSLPSPMANLLHTPTHYPALVDSTARLTIVDEENVGIRRCLFPFDRDTPSGANQHPAEKISKRSSKARLKRL